MKNIIVVAISLAVLSCGKKKGEEGVKNKNLTPFKTEISGDIGNNLQIIGEAKMEVVDEIFDNMSIQVQLKTIKATNESFYGLEDNNDSPLYLELTNKDGIPISGWEHMRSSRESDEKLKALIQSEGSEEWITFIGEGGKTGEGFNKYKTIPKGIEKFTVYHKRKFKLDKKVQNDDIPERIKSKSGNNYDQMLDEYEAYVDQYIKFYKKAMKGDNSALSEYPSLMEKATKFGKELEKVQGEMSPAQIKRMAEIQTKMIKGIM